MNSQISETIFSLYFLTIFIGTLLLSKFFPFLLENGRNVSNIQIKKMKYLKPIEFFHNLKISKKYFFVLYIIPFVLLFIPTAGVSLTVFFIHPFRRLLESIVYSRKSKSYMTSVQFIHGLLYYLILTLCMKSIKIDIKQFLILNFLQGIAHFRVYYQAKREYFHYYSEALIHFFLYISSPNASKFLNFIYVLCYVCISSKQRKISSKSD